MNPPLKINDRCRVYLNDPLIEQNPAYIEGEIVDVNTMDGIYLCRCTFDSAFDDVAFDNEPGLSMLSRSGKEIKIPIAPDQGDFKGRIFKI